MCDFLLSTNYDHPFQANGMAAMGKYEGEDAAGAAAESLFVAKHAY